MASQTKAVAIKENLLRPKQEELAETKTGGTSRKIMLRHRFEVATRKEDIVGLNRKLMSRPERNAEWTCNVSSRKFQVATKI